MNQPEQDRFVDKLIEFVRMAPGVGRVIEYRAMESVPDVGAYVGITIAQSASQGRPDLVTMIQPDGTTCVKAVGLIQYTVLVDFVRFDDPQQAAITFGMWCSLPSAIAASRQRGFAVLGRDRISDLTGLVEGEFELRAQLQMMVTARVETELEGSGRVDVIDIEGTVDPDGARVTATVDPEPAPEPEPVRLREFSDDFSDDFAT